jgi:hypothetical protein
VRALAALLAAALLAGCAGQGAPATPSTGPAVDAMRIAGLVESDALVPLANATVAIASLNLSVVTDARGLFAFEPLPPRAYLVEASLAGYRSQPLVARPGTNEGSLDFVLQRVQPVLPYRNAYSFDGHIECGAEALIISGPCDAAAQEAGVPPVLDNTSSFRLAMEAGWRSIIVDVVFDPEANPGMDGLRLAVRGPRDGDALDRYEQYGRFHGSAPYTVRLDAGEAYPDGTAPVDGNQTALVLDAYPQGHAWHAACDPTGLDGRCLAGLGAGANIDFSLYVTVFYVEPAPEGFTLRTDP